MIKKITVLFFIIVSAALADIGQYRANEVVVRNNGGKTYGAITNAIHKVGTKATVFIIDGGSWNITNSINVPQNISLDIVRGSVMELSSGVCVSVPGGIIDGMSQKFSSATTGAYSATNPWRHVGSVSNTPFARPEWFGAKVNDSVDDSIAISSAMNASEAVELSAGQYDVERCIFYLLPHNVVVKGAGRDQTIIKRGTPLYDRPSAQGIPTAGTAVSILIVGNDTNYMPSSVQVSDIWFDCGFDEIQSDTDWVGVTEGFAYFLGSGHAIRNCKVSNFGVSDGGASCYLTTFASGHTNAVSPCYFENNEVGPQGNPALFLTPSEDMHLVMQVPDIHDPVVQGCLSASALADSARHTRCVDPTKSRLYVRNNIVHDVGVDAAASTPLFPTYCFTVICGEVADNHIYDANGAAVMVQDTYVVEDLVVRNNVARGVRRGIELTQSAFGGIYRNVVIEGNVIEFETDKTGTEPLRPVNLLGNNRASWMFTNYSYKLSCPWSNIVIRGNIARQRYPGAVAATIAGIQIDAASDMYIFPNSGSPSTIPSIGYQTNAQYANIVVADNFIERLHSTPQAPEVRAYAPTYMTNYAVLSTNIKEGLAFTFSNNRILNGGGLCVPYKDSSMSVTQRWTSREGTFYTPYLEVSGVVTTAAMAVTGNLSAPVINARTQYFGQVSYRSILPMDGGFGNATNWVTYPSWDAGNVSIRGGQYYRSTNEYLYGRSSWCMIPTNDRVSDPTAMAAARYQYPAYVPCVSGALYTAGAFFMTHTNGVVAYVQNYDTDSRMNVYSPNVALTPGQWTLVSVKIPVWSNTVRFDLRYGLTTTSPSGGIAYVDNAFLCHGALATNEFVYADEVFFHATATNFNPLFIGEEVYDTTISAWYKAKGFTTNDWVKLN